MPTATYFQTEIKNAGRTDNASPQVTVNTGSDVSLSQGETFTVGSTTYTYQGLVSSVPVNSTTTTNGFYATQGGRTFLFTNADPANNVVPTLTPGDSVVCFLGGTHIATPSGNVLVETLSIGDLVLTASGAAVPVRWVGRQTIATLFGLRDADLPVCISAGALGDGLPVRDLRVTPGHAMLIDGVLVNAGALVNGSTITQVARADLGERFTVFHIETENHDIILAEGAPTETFVDAVTRAHFDNFAEYEALFGTEACAMPERAEPRACSPRQVPAAIRARIAAQVPAVAAAA